MEHLVLPREHLVQSQQTGVLEDAILVAVLGQQAAAPLEIKLNVRGGLQLAGQLLQQSLGELRRQIRADQFNCKKRRGKRLSVHAMQTRAGKVVYGQPFICSLLLEGVINQGSTEARTLKLFINTAKVQICTFDREMESGQWSPPLAGAIFRSCRQ